MDIINYQEGNLYLSDKAAMYFYLLGLPFIGITAYLSRTLLITYITLIVIISLILNFIER